jgi:hypothetical protein
MEDMTLRELSVWLIVGAWFVYFMPSWIAIFRRHDNEVAIMALNIFGGWTVVGWVGALVWSLLAKRPNPEGFGPAWPR